jgi:hypothetical protein
MAAVITASFEKLTLEVETATPGTYTKIAGMLDVTITRTANIDSSEIPDASDESLPLTLHKQVRSLDVKVTATGVWAQSSNKLMMDWSNSAMTKNVRLTNAAAASGDPSIETGPALLAKLEIRRSKGKQVTADLDIEFAGLPVVTNAV